MFMDSLVYSGVDQLFHYTVHLFLSEPLKVELIQLKLVS